MPQHVIHLVPGTFPYLFWNGLWWATMYATIFAIGYALYLYQKPKERQWARIFRTCSIALVGLLAYALLMLLNQESLEDFLASMFPGIILGALELLLIVALIFCLRIDHFGRKILAFFGVK